GRCPLHTSNRGCPHGRLGNGGPGDSPPDRLELERRDHGLEERRPLTWKCCGTLVQVVQQRCEQRIRERRHTVLRQRDDLLVRNLVVLDGFASFGVHDDLRWLT